MCITECNPFRIVPRYNDTMLIKDVGEFGLIEILKKVLESEAFQVDARLLVGIGDDAAAWTTNASTTVLTTDTMVEGVHFTRNPSRWSDVGWKAMAVNLSDIAAMGCHPDYAVVTLGLAKDQPVSELVEIYQGFSAASKKYEFGVVGGDLVRSETFFISVAIVGTSQNSLILQRDTAQSGDTIAVTGTLGTSAGGLRQLAKDPSADTILSRAHMRPTPRVETGSLLGVHGAHSAIDISHGLIDDLSKLCTASSVGAVIDPSLLPVDPTLKSPFPKEWQNLAMTGGEDYELLFTGPLETIQSISTTTDVLVTAIGHIVSGAEVVVQQANESPITYDATGWDHFDN